MPEDTKPKQEPDMSGWADEELWNPVISTLRQDDPRVHEMIADFIKEAAPHVGERLSNEELQLVDQKAKQVVASAGVETHNIAGIDIGYADIVASSFLDDVKMEQEFGQKDPFADTLQYNVDLGKKQMEERNNNKGGVGRGI